MEYTMKPVVDCYELEEAVKIQFGLDQLDLGRACFEMCENDSYQRLCFDDEKVEELEDEISYAEEYNRPEIEYLRQKRLVYTYLRDVFLPKYDEVIVSYYW